MTNKPFVGIVPYELRRTKDLGEILISKLINDQPLEHSDKKIKDLTQFDHIIVYPCSKIWITNYKKLKCMVSLMIAEPKAIHRKYYKKIWLLRFKFHTIFVRYTALTNKYKNVIIAPIGGCCIPNLSNQDFLKKNKFISLIASDKKFLIGHKLRHQIVEKITNKNIDVMGRGYMPFKDKQDGLLPYYFSIVIENSQEQDYFTEKITDAFACKTVPIYWGCPNIGDYFDIDGIIIFQTIDELKAILDNLTPEDYQKYTATMDKNLTIARKLSNTSKIVTDELLKIQHDKQAKPNFHHQS